MRVFEILFLLSVIFAFVNMVFLKKNNLLLPSIISSLVLFVSSVCIEGYRIQVFPVCVLLVLMYVACIIRIKLPALKVWKPVRIVSVCLLMLVLVIAVALPMLFPVVDFPKPSGKYSIGTSLLSFTDASRMGVFTSSDTPRKLSVRVWYPADKSACSEQNRRVYTSNAICISVEKVFKMPYLVHHLTLVNTNSYSDVPVAPGKHKFPVIVFSHGYQGIAEQNTSQMEEMASNGYVVFSITHTYEAAGSTFPDGITIPSNPMQVEPYYKDFPKTTINENGEIILVYSDYTSAIQRKGPVFESLNTWCTDTIFVTDQIEKLNSGEIPSKFKERLDVANIGVFGHSFGGASAGKVCAMDKRFKAGINMDGAPFLVFDKITQPFMLLTEKLSKKALLAGYYPNQKLLTVSVDKTSHYDFTDFTILLPILRYTGLLGNISSNKQEKIMNDYILAFFNKYLKGMKEPLIDNKLAKYPEVTVEQR